MSPLARSFALLLAGAIATAPQTLPCQEPTAPAPLLLVGEFVAQLEHVAADEDSTVVLTLAVGTLRSAIDKGDEVRVFDPKDDSLLTTAQVVTGTRTEGESGRVHVRVRLAEPEVLPRLIAVASTDAARPGGRARVTIASEFDPTNGDVALDFVRIEDTTTGRRVADPSVVPPQCSFVLRFREPVQPASLWQLQLVVEGDNDPTTAVLPIRIIACDATNTVFALMPPRGLCFTPEMREAAQKDRELPLEQRRVQYRLHIEAGDTGLRSAAGGTLRDPIDVPIRLDPDGAINRVSWHTWR